MGADALQIGVREVTRVDPAKAAVAATRAADLADRAEVAGMLVVASMLRAMARDLEEILIAQQPPPLPRWLRS